MPGQVFIKAKSANIVQEDYELVGEAVTEDLWKLSSFQVEKFSVKKKWWRLHKDAGLFFFFTAGNWQY